MEGPDHEFALEPDELEAMVSAIRNTERALGSGAKQVLEVEEELHRFARRHIQAARHLEPGSILSEDDVAILRPGGRSPGVAPRHLEELLGSRINRSVSKGDGITWEDVE
jgi:N-acetylneuraminate synthase